jgi:hypothetical protein
MPSNQHPSTDASDQELALWMLDRMQDSEKFLAVIKAARVAGKRDVLDSSDYVETHQTRLKKFYQSDTEEDAPMSSSTAARIEALMKRDLLSSKEELLEKALAAYLEQHPSGRDGLPAEWASTFSAARDEIEGRTSGAFEPGFTAGLAASAREALARQAGEQFKGRAQDGRESY